MHTYIHAYIHTCINLYKYIHTQPLCVSEDGEMLTPELQKDKVALKDELMATAKQVWVWVWVWVWVLVLVCVGVICICYIYVYICNVYMYMYSIYTCKKHIYI